jgi:hypothetical protein
MNEWFDPKDKLPEDGQECLLMPIGHGGMTTIAVYGPINWHDKDKIWMDIFRDHEAGSLVRPEQVGKWCDWSSIAPKDENAEA